MKAGLKIGEEAKVHLFFIGLWVVVGLLTWALNTSSNNHQGKPPFDSLAQGNSLTK